MIWAGPYKQGKFNHINWMIKWSLITFCGFHCIRKKLHCWIKRSFLYQIYLNPLGKMKFLIRCCKRMDHQDSKNSWSEKVPTNHPIESAKWFKSKNNYFGSYFKTKSLYIIFFGIKLWKWSSNCYTWHFISHQFMGILRKKLVSIFYGVYLGTIIFLVIYSKNENCTINLF